LDCDCDVGGSTDRGCDAETGECSCRPHLTGRQCSQPDPGYYIPSTDALSVRPSASPCPPNATDSYPQPCTDVDLFTFNNISVTLPQPNITWYVQKIKKKCQKSFQFEDISLLSLVNILAGPRGVRGCMLQSTQSMLHILPV